MPNSFFQIPPDSTGKKIASLEQTIGPNTVQVQLTDRYEPPTFVAIADRVVPAVNKYILTLFNTLSTRKVVIHRAFVYNWQAAGVTGTILEYEFKRITARTVGTTITPVPYDTADTITSGITADHTTTSVTDSSLLRRGFASGEETKIGALTLENLLSVDDVAAMIYEKKDGCKGIACRQNEGVTIKNITGTVGSISAVMLFTDEPV
jgi:hypothetical protein